MDDPTYFTSSIWKSLGANPIIFGNPVIRERLCQILCEKIRYAYKDSLDNYHDSLLDHILGKIADKMYDRIKVEDEHHFQPKPIKKEGNEGLYEMVESFKRTDYRSRLFDGHEFIIDREEILKRYNEYIKEHPNETYCYSGIRVDKQTGGISLQYIKDDYSRSKITEEQYTPDEKGNVIYTILYSNLSKDEISKFRSFITTYNNPEGTEMKKEDILYGIGIEEKCIYTRDSKYPFVTHCVSTSNNSEYEVPEGAATHYAIRLEHNKLVSLNDLEYDGDSPNYVTFNSEEEIKEYYERHKKEIDKCLKKLGLEIDFQGRL